MPFKLKLKKSRQYNVMSKSLFVISIELLDSSTVDCTLSSESTGQECLENVCQRISINQPEFFGLRYIMKGTKDESRWVDLERPLNRQLEKYAANSKILYLKVMYYVISGVSLITDEVTRNHYFLQLKYDVVEGKISCDPKQAVILGNYSRQAEYGNHQERHTVDYLKTLLSFPKHFIEQGLLETLTEEVIQQHAELHNVTQGTAEELYVTACQQLNGYGQESFAAKDALGTETILGISVSGIIAAASDMHRFYPWRDITNVVNHKRTFNIECTDPQKSVGFTLSDADTGRYVWKLCVLQHTFYVKHEQNQNNSSSQVNLNIFQNMPENLNDSRDDLLASDQQHQQLHQSQTNWHPSDSHLSLATAGSTWTTNTETPITTSNMASRTSLQTSALDINNLTTTVPLDYSNRSSNWALNPLNSNPSLINRTQSSSCLDLSNNNNINSSNNNIGPDRDHLKALLPSYRPAPDYDTAIQQKYHSSSSELRINSNGGLMSSSQMLAAAAAAAAVSSQPTFESSSHIDYNNITGSQPDVHRITTANNLESYYNSQQLQQPYPDVTQHHITNPIIGPKYSDASDYGLSQRFKMMRLIKPPPPYPANRLSSTSTPDLALASHRALLGYRGAYVSGSSPDLVSTRPFLHQQQQQQQQQHHLMQIPGSHQILYPATRLRHSQGILPHGTYENLNFNEPTKTSLLSQHMQHKYDGNNFIYLVPRDVEHRILHDKQTIQYQSNGGNINGNNIMMNSSSSQHNINGSIEPIYENVPLPHPPTPSWKNENHSKEMRDRTSSVQSAPGVIRNNTEASTNKSAAPQPAITMTSSNHNNSNNNINNINNNNNNANNNNNNNYHMMSENKETYTKNSHAILSKTSSNPIINQNNYQNNNNNNNNINNYTNSSQTLNHTPHLAKPIINNNSFKNDANDTDLNNKNNMNDSRVDSLNRSQSTNILDFTQSSSYTIDTNTTTDSGISSGSKEKKRKIWNILSRSKNSSDKQKSATLGREKDKSSKKAEQLGKESDSHLRHRWSTGQPRLQPLPANISKESLCQLLETKLADTELFYEFERIPKRRENAKYDCALHDENRNKNYDSNYLPYDDNRVRLTPARDNKMGYVNASHITSTVGTKQRFYIVAQSPHDKLTSNIFWQCVWEADAYLLVQLSNELTYIPTTSDRCLEYEHYQVWREFSQETDRCVTSKLRVYHTQSRRYRSIWHLSYSEWAEQNCPKDVAHFLGFLEELSSVRLASINEVPPGHNTNPPVLIHCNEGGGRGGIALAADLLLYTLDHNQDLDIPRVIGLLRQQRDNIIPSLAQYKFIYALLIHYLKQTRLI